MESAQHRKKESTSQAARYVKSCRLKSTGAPPVYGTGWANFPWAALDADLSKRGAVLSYKQEYMAKQRSYAASPW